MLCRVKILAFEKNRGLGLALRDGVFACRNEYIARMDSDDIAKPEGFLKQITYLEKNPEMVFIRKQDNGGFLQMQSIRIPLQNFLLTA